MNYKKLHDDIILRAKSRICILGEYYENHHIIPKCMQGSNESENLVKLTAREHFLIHWLLVEIHKNSEYYSKLVYAWNSMCRLGKGHKQRNINSRYFKYSREKHSEISRYKLLNSNHLTSNPEVVNKIIKTRKINYDRNKSLGLDTQYDKSIRIQLDNAKVFKSKGLPTQWDIGGLKCTNTYINKSRLKWGSISGKDLASNKIIYYESPLEAAKDLNGHAGTIAQCALGNRNYAYGYEWKFSKNNND